MGLHLDDKHVHVEHYKDPQTKGKKSKENQELNK